MPILSGESIAKAFGPTRALDNVSFTVEEGEIHALVGENGSGKSTLMRILNGEERMDSGSLQLNGEAYQPSSPRDAAQRGITLIHQELAICEHLTALENIFLGSELKKNGRLAVSEMRRHASEALAHLGHPDLPLDQLARHRTPAERQVIEIARALRANASILLLDEPTSSLGATDVQALFEVIRKLKQEGKTIIYITHFLDEIVEIADRATILRDGHIVQTMEKSELEPHAIASAMVGRDIEQVYHRSERSFGEPVLELVEVSGRQKPLGASLALRRGEILGIAGLNGSGRTETLRLAFGLDQLEAGTVRIGNDDRKPTPRRSWQSGVGFLSEDRKLEGLAQNLSISENISLPRRDGALVNPGRQDARAQAAIEAMRIKCAGPNQPVQHLSGGNQQKVAISRLLDSECEVLLLDEPTKGIDVGSKAEIYKLIDQLASQGKSVIFVSSFLPELTELCDRIAVFNRGKLVQIVDARATSQVEVMQWCAGA